MNHSSTTIALQGESLEHWVEKAKRGDEQAFTKLVEGALNTVNAIALSITKDLSDSHDVTQQVFIKMWHQLDQLQNSQSLMPWLRQITRYTAYNYLRDNKKNKWVPKEDAEIETLLSDVCDNTDSYDKTLIKNQQSTLIRHLIEQLPDESREVVVLYYREDNNSSTVAKLLGISESSVRKKLQRARQVIKEQILTKYGQVIFATGPISMVSLFTTVAMTSSPVAAATLSTGTATGNANWFIKLLSGLGGALLGGIIAIIANTFAMKYIMKHIDNSEDIHQLKRIKFRSNLIIIITCILFSLSYSYSKGWLFPVLTYSMFIAGLVVHISAANKISFANLGRKAKTDSRAAKQLARDKLTSRLGWILGLGGGTFGLLFGLYTSGRFDVLF